MGHLCQRLYADVQQAAAGGTLLSSLVRAQVILMAVEHVYQPADDMHCVPLCSGGLK